MRHWVQKRAGESLTTITELVWDQASKVLLEFSDLLKDDSFEIRFRPVSDLADSVEWGSFATLVTVEQAIDFYRRIFLPNLSWPRNVFWFIRSKHDHVCHQRRAVAQELLGLQEVEVDRNFTWKFRNHFRSDIEDAATTGMLSQTAWD